MVQTNNEFCNGSDNNNNNDNDNDNIQRQTTRLIDNKESIADSQCLQKEKENER